jgi:hypothetical protein
VEPDYSLPAFTTPSKSSAAAMAVILASLVATVWAACFNHPFLWTLTGIGEADKPFLDLCNILSAGEAVQRGIDPLIRNPMDPYNRAHAYSTWWLITGPLGLTVADASWLGAILLVATLVSAWWLLAPTDWRRASLLALILVSPPLLLAVSRANNDLVVFVLMCAALACFRSEKTAWRGFGIMLLALSAVLKYFPLAAALLLLEARSRRELVFWAAIYLLVLVVAWPGLEPGLRTALRHAPQPSWLYAFGAPVVFRNFDIVVSAGWLLAAFASLVIFGSWPVLRALPSPAAPAPLPDAERLFACGAVMIVGCFLHGSTYAYKLLFSLWLLPWFWHVRPNGAEGFWRRLTLALLLALLFWEGSMAVILNSAFFLGTLSAPKAQLLLEAVLFINQLLAWSVAVCLSRRLLQYTLWHASRLGNIARHSSTLPVANPG